MNGSRSAAAVAGKAAVAIARDDVLAAGGGRASGAARVGASWRIRAVVGVSGVQVLGAGSGRGAGGGRGDVRQRQAGDGRAADRRRARADDDDVGFRSGARRSWNLLPTAPDPWPFIALANGIARVPGRRGPDATELPGRADGRVAARRRRSRCRVTCCRCRMASAVRQSLTPGQHDLVDRGDRGAGQLSRAGRRKTGAARSRLQRELAGGDEPAGARRGGGAR